MIYKCPNCDGALEYNPSHAKMECPYCWNVFEPQVAMQAASRAQMQTDMILISRGRKKRQ